MLMEINNSSALEPLQGKVNTSIQLFTQAGSITGSSIRYCEDKLHRWDKTTLNKEAIDVLQHVVFFSLKPAWLSCLLCIWSCWIPF